jgi:glycosyltransferase involved in cell wall biosynthesis
VAAPGGSTRVRVLWLVKGLGPGGAEHLLVAAAGRHDRDRFDLRAAYLLPWKQQLAPELESLGVSTTCLEVRDERDLRWAIRLRRELLDRPVDVLHAHSPYPAGIARLVVRTLPARVRPRLVYTLHNTWSSFARPTRAVNGATMRWDDADLAVSEIVRDSLSEARRARTEVLVHGIDLDAVRSRADRLGVRAEFGIQDDVFVVGTVANLRRQKDYPNLLAAARLLADRGVRVRFLTVGQGPLEAEIHAEHARLGLEGVVDLLGERADAVRVMSGCDAFVLASDNEGLPVAIMEALALGLPIVATAVGGLPEAVDATNGILVPPKDPDALADALGALAGDPERRADLGRGAAATATRFDIGRTVERLESLYASLGTPRR